MKTRPARLLAVLLPALLLLAASSVLGEDELTTVTAKAVKLQVPKSWKAVKSSSEFRAAQFTIPPAEEGGEEAELVVFHFGGPTGGIKANVNRWVGQFQSEGRAMRMVRGKSGQGEYILADISGTWKKPDGPPFAQKTVNKPNSRVINVILITEQDKMKDYYFLKLSGPDKLVQSQAAALRKAIGTEADSEKPF
jgi:hypothetical protein